MNQETQLREAADHNGNPARCINVEGESHTNYAVVGLPEDTLEDRQAGSLVDNLSASMDFEIMAFGGQATVCAALPKEGRRSTAYQSEADLEKAFVDQLQRQAYEHVAFSSEAELVANLRCQLELLNDFAFTDREWQRFFKASIASENEGIVEKTRRIQRDYVQVLRRDDGSVKNVRLIDKRNIHNNCLQVMSQYAQSGAYDNRYDVTE